MGGIPTNLESRVVIDDEEHGVPGMYAAGECACVRVHGANRLGTNSLIDILVFGRRAGRSMADDVRAANGGAAGASGRRRRSRSWRRSRRSAHAAARRERAEHPARARRRR